MKVREVIGKLEKDGWYPLKGGRTNHHHFKHPTKPGKVSVPGNPGHEVSKKVLSCIRRQAGWQ